MNNDPTPIKPMPVPPDPAAPQSTRGRSRELLPSVAWNPRDLALALLVLFFVFAVGVVLLNIFTDGQESFSDELFGMPLVTWAAIAQGVAGIGVAFGFSVVRYGVSVRDLGFTGIGIPRDFGFALGAWAAAIGVTIVYALLVNALKIEFLKAPETAQDVISDSGGLLPAMLLAAVWAPLNEEIFFRGFVLPGFASRYSTRTAVILSSAVFAAFHVHPGAFVPTFVLGAALAMTYVRSGSLIPSILLHAAHNSAVILITYYAPDADI